MSFKFEVNEIVLIPAIPVKAKVIEKINKPTDYEQKDKEIDEKINVENINFYKLRILKGKYEEKLL